MVVNNKANQEYKKFVKKLNQIISIYEELNNDKFNGCKDIEVYGNKFITAMIKTEIKLKLKRTYKNKAKTPQHLVNLITSNKPDWANPINSPR